MTINEIILESLTNPTNYNEDGSVNWSFVDSDLWLHPEANNFTDDELIEGLENFPDALIPSIIGVS